MFSVGDSRGKSCDVAEDYRQHWTVAMGDMKTYGGSIVVYCKFKSRRNLLRSPYLFFSILQLSCSIITLSFEASNARAMASASSCRMPPSSVLDMFLGLEILSIVQHRLVGFVTTVVDTKGHKAGFVFATSSSTIRINLDLDSKKLSLLSELRFNTDGILIGPVVG